MPVFQQDELRDLSAAILEGVGTPPDLARIVGDSLVDANLVGHDSHGVLRVPQYCEVLPTWGIVPDARAKIVARERGTARIDGGMGWGQPAMLLATETAIELAREHGLGAAVLDRGYHIGRVAPYVEMAAAAGMVGIAMSNAGAAVAPYGAAIACSAPIPLPGRCRAARGRNRFRSISPRPPSPAANCSSPGTKDSTSLPA